MTGRILQRLLLILAASLAPGIGWGMDPDTRFYVPDPNRGATEQIRALMKAGGSADASLVSRMIHSPQAVWFTQGTPRTVLQDVRSVVADAARKRSVPILVAYDIPFRDCSQFSAGGAETAADYRAWITAFAAGIGTREAVVILEPDGLGIIPWYTPLNGSGFEWCQPAEADPETAADERFAMLNFAVDVLRALPNVRVYLDATNSAWLGVGDAGQRLVRAGVARADGFFLNVSNYQFTANSVEYGTWISSCIAYATIVNPGDFGACPSQYWNGGPLPSKIAQLLGEWTGVALNAYGEWSDTADYGNLNTSGINLRYANMLGTTLPSVKFVVDTSRNGQGPWLPPADHPAGDPQDWCNPPDRGVGMPTAGVDQGLLDAHLWVKIPGESDGQCFRWSTGPLDPVWNLIDPPAGQWFPQMALDLVQLANPPLP